MSSTDFKNVVVLGSTGSIGINTLKVIERYPNRFKVFGLSAYNNVELLEKQIKLFSPKYVAVSDVGFKYFKKRRLPRVKFINVDKDLEVLVAEKAVTNIVIGMRGSAALAPFLSAVRHGKTVAPANKEALVIAGDIIMSEARRHKAVIIPVDSEQSAIFQCLQGQNRQELKKVWLTASGGTLRKIDSSKFDRLTVQEVLAHPRWKMGKKITVDSATLMNKGFEIIEAMRLFNLRADQIEVIIHPEAVIHSMVEFIDGSIMAQLGVTDMRLPIQYALTYPERLNVGLKNMDFYQLKSLNFEKPNYKKFPALSLAIHVAKTGGTLPSVLNAADEEVVEAYLNGKIKFTEIPKIIEKLITKHKVISNPKLNQILEADQWARVETRKVIHKK
ncbi:MAG: 1-deoxy-D-xylulose-5-phosphate reductoisomerase [Candidatus Omnitrophica bacterium]|nr:1-deoxy-D-xylulose-5-phosphate reductoisomerase [Candidatus Omnitrophota bacterium]